MEIEAKFSVPDDEAFRRLLETDSVGTFHLDPPSAVQVHDRYFDTADRDLYTAGYACRLRREGDRYLASVKGPGDTKGAVHHRIEQETVLPGPLAPSAWPASQAHTLVTRLSQGKPLELLFEILQERCRRLVCDAGQPVAELSFDRVQVRLQGTIADKYLEVEAELSPPGKPSQLERLAHTLQQAWGLQPRSRSKFERALDIRDTHAAPSRR